MKPQDHPEFDFSEQQKNARREEFRHATAAELEQIKKLFRLAADQRGNPHEAELALQKAFKRAEKFRIDVASLDLDEECEQLISERWEMGQRFDRLRRGIVDILLKFFHVNVVISSPRMVVIGKPHDVAIARYVHDFLLRAGREGLRSFVRAEKAARRKTSGTKNANYLEGFIYGLTCALRNSQTTLELTDKQNALVVREDEERQRMVKSMFPDAGKVKELADYRLNESALSRGYRDGQATKITQPLAGTPGGPLLLQ